MKNSFEEIEKYLNNQMTSDEKKEFEDFLAQDSSLREKVKIQQLEHDAMEFIVENDLRKKMETWKEEPKKSVLRISFLKIGLAAAAILVAVVFMGKLLLNPDTPTPLEIVSQDNLKDTLSIADLIKERRSAVEKEIAKENTSDKEKLTRKLQEMQNEKLIHEDLIAAVESAYGEGPLFKNTEVRGSGGNSTNLQMAITAYQDRKYSIALENIEKVDVADIQAQFLKANVYMKQKNYKLALPLFQKIVNSKNILYAENAEFYGALCNISLNNINDAKKTMLKITQDSEHSFYSKALEIQKKIEVK